MKYIFGPVASRRLGASLGVDLIPHKICSYDCIYCELGRTVHKTISRKEYVSCTCIVNELKERLDSLNVLPDYITLGGSGEPTLNSEIGGIIKEIKKLTSVPVAVLTNGSLLCIDEVQESLLGADVVLPSFDAISQEVFNYINRPHPSLKIEEIIQGIIDFRKVFCGEIWIEIVFCRVVNDDKGEIQRMKEVLENINPDKIQLNTVVRPPADDFAFALNAQQLEDIREMMGEKAEVITVPSRTIMEFGSLSGEEHIVELLRRRPCVLGDISVALGIQQIESIKMINKLMEEEKIEYCVYNHQSFYKIKEGS